MSWYDRDYARQPAGFSGGYRAGSTNIIGGLAGRSIITTLIIINVAVFVLCGMTGGFPTPAMALDGTVHFVGGSVLYRWGFLTAPAVLEQGQVWRLITCTFLHADLGHVFMNMLGLYFLGPAIEQRWGRRMTLGVYMTCGVVANMFYLFLAGTGYFEAAWVPLVGASGCVLALLGAAAVMFPQAVVLIMLVFPMKIRTAAVVFVVWWAWKVYTKGANAGGDAVHLVGMLSGAWWAWRGQFWWDARGKASWARLIGRSRGGRSPVGRSASRASAGRPGSFKRRMREREADQAMVDRILKKVHDGGLHTLTEAEKRALTDATARMQAAEDVPSR